jgi:tetratricopeptide (TPR) repeat protein
MNLKFLPVFLLMITIAHINVIMGQNLIVTDSLLMLLNRTDDKEKQQLLLKELSDEVAKSDIGLSNSYAQRGLELARSENNRLLQAEFYTVMAHNEYFIGNYKESLELYLKSLELYEKIDNIRGIIGVNVNLGAIYDRLGDEERSLGYYKKALSGLNEEGQKIISENPEFKTVLYNNIASVYSRMGDSLRYNEYIGESLKSALASNDFHNQGVIYNNLGLGEVRKKNYPKARSYFGLSIASRKKIGDIDGLAKTYQFMVDYYLGMHQYDSALLSALESKKLAQEINSLETQMNASNSLSKIYELMGRFDEALSENKNFSTLSDSIKNDKIIRQTTQIQANYELAKVEKTASLEKQKMRFTFIIVTILLVFIIVVAVLLLVVRHLKNKKTLAEKLNLEHQIELKNKEFATNVMYLIRKNELINSVAKKLMVLKDEVRQELKTPVQRIIFELQSEVDNEVWQEFEYRFMQVHQEFYSKLRREHPDLTPSEERICAFLKLNMSSKEIAAITHQNVKSIEVVRARIRKKCNLTNTDANLVAYFADF